MNDEIRKQVEDIKAQWDSLKKDNEELSAAFSTLFAKSQQLKQEVIDSISISDAVDCIRYELLKSKEPGSYYHAWQCNIAMCFYDSMKNRINNAYGKLGITPIVDSESKHIHEAATEAAANFLDILCLTSSNNIGFLKQSV